MDVCDRLRIARLRAGFKSQKAVADALGIERTRYLKYETGTYSPPLEMLARMCKLFEVSADYVLGIVEEPVPISTEGLTTEEVVKLRRLIAVLEGWNDAEER